MEYLDYSGLKVQLLGSIIAVSSINILRCKGRFVCKNRDFKSDQFLWLAIFHGMFLASVLIIAVVERTQGSA